MDRRAIRRRCIVIASTMLVFILLLAHVTLAQEAGIEGTITDVTGAAVPGVSVTALHIVSGNTFTSVSDSSGKYRFAVVRAGTYKITAELSGFNTVVKNNVELLVGQHIVLNLQMEVSKVSETVTVTGGAPLVDTTQSQIAGNIDPRQMQDVPINGRNWLALAALAPGASGNSITTAPMVRDNGAFQLNVDGQQVSSIISASSFGEPQFSQDAIAEFQVITNRFDATQGRSYGIQVNAVTKSGTNNFLGTTFGYFRDNKFNAPDPVVHRVLPYSDQQMGGTFGGPIVKDKVID